GGLVRPTDDTIALVAFLFGRPWLSADEIRHGIARLGFEMPSGQWVAARLNLMVKEDAPRFNRQTSYGGINEYSVTGFAANGLANQWRGFSRIGGSGG